MNFRLVFLKSPPTGVFDTTLLAWIVVNPRQNHAMLFLSRCHPETGIYEDCKIYLSVVRFTTFLVLLIGMDNFIYGSIVLDSCQRGVPASITCPRVR